MNFLCQKINNKITFDFVFAMSQAEDYYSWFDKDGIKIRWTQNPTFKSIEAPQEYIPVGSVEFVSDYMCKFYPEAAKKALKPLNVPEIFYPFAGRSIGVFDNRKAITRFFGDERVFCKSTSLIKSAVNGVYRTDMVPDGEELQVSSIVDIASEWRVFVHNGIIQHISNYSGDCLKFPDAYTVKQIVDCWQGISPNEVPKAWTLDVAVTEKGETIVMECHRFFSCGLYGFNDLQKIPIMFSQEWHNMINMYNPFEDIQTMEEDF